MRLGYRTVLFFIAFLLPLVVFSYYQLRIATDRFHSDSILAISEGAGSTPTVDLSMVGLPSVAESKDALTLVAFITSLDMLRYLDDKLQLRQHFSDTRTDWISRLPAEASWEDFHEYIQDYIVVEYDITSHLVTVHVEAFSREMSHQIVTSVLERSQKFIDHLNSRMTTEQSRFFEDQLRKSETRVRDAKNQLLIFQRKNGVLTVESEATLINTGLGTLNGLLLAKQGELEVRGKQLNENSPVIKSLEDEVKILRKQIGEEKDRLSVGTMGSSVSELAAEFSEIQLNLEFVQTVHKTNLVQLEQARVAAIQRLKYLVVVTSPSLADASLYPNRIYNIGTAILLLLMIYFVLSLMVAIIREHA